MATHCRDAVMLLPWPGMNVGNKPTCSRMAVTSGWSCSMKLAASHARLGSCGRCRAGEERLSNDAIGTCKQGLQDLLHLRHDRASSPHSPHLLRPRVV